MSIIECNSQHFDERMDGATIDTVVIHSMCAPDSPLPEDPAACIACLDQHQVSAHFLIARDGAVWRLVPEEKRAWHAGVSKLHDGREDVNHYSIGIELLAREKTKFSQAQYEQVVQLVADLVRKFPIMFIVGHEDIAQPAGRKRDPGPHFDWERLRDLIDADPMTAHITFPFRQFA